MDEQLQNAKHSAMGVVGAEAQKSDFKSWWYAMLVPFATLKS